MPRQAFLLVSVEGFLEEDAAAILDVDMQTLQDLVDQSGRDKYEPCPRKDPKKEILWLSSDPISKRTSGSSCA